jgi:uncharacterized membrane protein YeiB
VERIVGVDVARGVAVLGMMTAHVGVAGPDLWSTDGWLGIADGRSAALFAVLAGLSIGLISGGPRPVTGARLTQSRVRILVRGALLLLLGTFLSALGTPIAVILQVYGLLFAFAVPVLRVPPSGLVVLAAAIGIGAPALCFALTDVLTAAGNPPTGLLEILLAGYYPAGIWLAYLLAGLAVGRSDLRSPALRARLAVVGVALAAAGYGGGVLAARAFAGQPESVLRLVSVEPHSDSTFEVAGNIGVALLVLALCLVVADRFPRVVVPLAATGALALTAYSVHIMVIFVIGSDVVREPRVGPHLGFLVVTMAATTLWRALWGRGPFERALHSTSVAIAAMVVPAPGPPSAQGQTSPDTQPSAPRR